MGKVNNDLMKPTNHELMTRCPLFQVKNGMAALARNTKYHNIYGI